MSSSLYRSYGNHSKHTHFPNYKRMSHLPACLPPIEKTYCGCMNCQCQLNHHLSPLHPLHRSKYLPAGLRSGHPNVVSTWKNNSIYQ